jgi:radical SAM protein with 4Fe4S-binding SPASM domain
MNFPFLLRALDAAVMKRRLTARRLQNLFLVLVEHFLTQPTRTKGQPLRLIVDPTNHCDLSCPLCPTGQGRLERERGVMSFEHFKTLFLEAAPTLLDIDFYCWGEPLLHRRLPDMIALAAEQGVASIVSTHLNHVTPSLAQSLVACGLQRLTVSLDGASARSYQVYRRGGDFDAVLRNVALMAETKKRLNSKTPRLVWQFIVNRHNEGEVAEAHRSYRRLGFDALRVRPLRCDLGRELEMSDAQKEFSVLDFAAVGPAFKRYDSGHRVSPAKRCLFLWTQSVVHPNGAVSPCCGVYDPAHDVGNAFDEGLLSVWNNSRYQNLREGVRLKNPSAQSPCATCVREGFLEY